MLEQAEAAIAVAIAVVVVSEGLFIVSLTDISGSCDKTVDSFTKAHISLTEL